MSDLHLPLFKKEWPWVTCSCHSLQKSDESDLLSSLVIVMSDLLFRSLKMSDSLKKNSSISPCFLLLFPFLCPRTNHSRCSSLCRSFLKSNGSNLLSSFFTKERQEQNRFGKERITILLFRSQKTSNSLKKPKSEFSTLQKLNRKFNKIVLPSPWA